MTSSGDASPSSLPSDVIVQILSRLPIKSLFRCKSVCKWWYKLPSEKHFIDLHYKNSHKDPILIIESVESSSFIAVDRFTGVSPFSLGFLNDKVKIRASCNGFLCCSSARYRGVYYVCNPMTREFRVLPRTRERPITRCHPEYEDMLVGLAVDDSNWKFNVVLAGFRRFFGHRPGDQFVCQVFDSGSNSWDRSVMLMHDEFTHMNRCQVVFSNGSLHWLTHTSCYVLALDLRNGCWGKVSLPDEVIGGRYGSRIYLLELEGSVSVVQISGVWMAIWVLLNHGTDQWDLVDRVHLRCINVFAASVFPIAQNHDMVFMATQKKILTYHRRNKMWREIYGVKGNIAYPLWFSAYSFKSTLFSCHHQE